MMRAQCAQGSGPIPPPSGIASGKIMADIPKIRIVTDPTIGEDTVELRSPEGVVKIVNIGSQLQRVMAKIRELAEEDGHDPNDFAVKFMAEEFGELGGKFGSFMNKNADPVEALAWLMIETTKRKAAKS